MEDPTNLSNQQRLIKPKANKLITVINYIENHLKLKKIIGDYRSGNMCSNVKTDKRGIILHYIDSKHILTSTDDFLDLIKSNNYQGSIASLDVENLFFNNKNYSR